VTAPETYAIATEVAFVTTDDGEVVRLGQGDTLPENVHPDELARLLNGGVLEDYAAAPALLGIDGGEEDQAVTLTDEQISAGVDEIKLRVGTDGAAARAYLDAEQAKSKPRTSLIAHLEEVIAAEDTPTVSSADLTAEAEA
jgi:hypothetical protein